MSTRLLLALILGLFAIWPGRLQAVTLEAKDNVLADQNHVVTDTYLVGGGNVNLGGRYQNDVFIGGGSVTISGDVQGDVLIAGGTVKISGVVAGNVRAVGGTIEIGGVVEKNVTLAGASLLLETDSTIKGEVVTFGGTLESQGAIENDLSFWGGSAILNGAVNGNARIQTGDDCGDVSCVTLGPSTHISGNLEYWASRMADLQTGATVDGSTTRHEVEELINKLDLQYVFNGFRLWVLFSTMLVAIAIALFLPRSLRGVTETMVQQWGRSLGFGALVFFAAPVALIFLMLTIVGIPLAILLAVGYFIDIYLTSIFLGFFFGYVIVRALRRGQTAPSESRGMLVVQSLIGVLALSLVFDFLLGPRFSGGLPFINFIGGLVRFALVVWAFGGLILYKFSIAKSQAS